MVETEKYIRYRNFNILELFSLKKNSINSDGQD